MEIVWELKELQNYMDYLLQDPVKSRLPLPYKMSKEEKDEYNKGALSKAIENKNYGEDVDKIFIIMICREAGYTFKVRKRYTKEKHGVIMGIPYTEKNLIGIDCILDFNKTMSLSLKEQKLYLLQELKKTFTSIQTYKKKLKNFDFDAFENDIQKILDDEIIRIENENK
ncbi:MAG: hypothetical protein R2760_07230 [Chitinophagales bacterium]